MSFVIAVTDGNKAIMAADSQTTSYDMQVLENNYKKIKKFKEQYSIYVCFAGDVALAEYVFDKLNNLDFYNSISMSIVKCASLIREFADEFIRSNNLDRNKFFCHFILMIKNKTFVGSYKYHYSVYTVNTITSEISKITKFDGKYLWIYLDSGFVEREKIHNILRKNLYSKIPLPLGYKLRRIIKLMSKLDPTVNDNVYMMNVI